MHDIKKSAGGLGEIKTALTEREISNPYFNRKGGMKNESKVF